MLAPHGISPSPHALTEDANCSETRVKMSVRPHQSYVGASEPNTEDLAKSMSVLGADSAQLSAHSDGEPMPAPALNADAAPITRNVVVQIRASLNDLVQESSSARWQPTEGALNSICESASPVHTSHSLSRSNAAVCSQAEAFHQLRRHDGGPGRPLQHCAPLSQGHACQERLPGLRGRQGVRSGSQQLRRQWRVILFHS